MSKGKGKKAAMIKPWYERKWHEPMDSVDQFSLIYHTGNTIRHEWMSVLLAGYAVLYILTKLVLPIDGMMPADTAPGTEELPVISGTLDDVSYDVADAELEGKKATVELIIDSPDGVSSFLKPFHDAIIQLNPDVKEASIIVYPDLSEKEENRPSYTFEDGDIMAYSY